MRTAIYARVSTERQTLAQTIEQQVTRLTTHLDSQGETLRVEDIFRDDGYSGATLNRPGLDRLRIGSKRPRLTGLSSRVLIGSPGTMSIKWSFCKSSNRLAVASGSWISR